MSGLAASVGEAAGPQADHLAPVGLRHLRRRQRVIGMIEDDVGGAARAGGAEQARLRRKRRTVQREGGEIVRIQEDVVIVGNVARSRIEGAPVGGHLRPVLTNRGHRHPLAQQRMPAKFTHSFIVGCRAAQRLPQQVAHLGHVRFVAIALARPEVYHSLQKEHPVVQAGPGTSHSCRQARDPRPYAALSGSM